MTLNEFTRAVDDLCAYYERKVVPTPVTLDLWHGKSKHVPGEALQWIVRRITEEHETFPRNVPMAIRGAADEWWQAHPDKKAYENYRECPDCSEGLIFVQKRNERHNTTYSYVFRCERCRQSRIAEYPMMLLSSLINNGYNVPKHMDAARKASAWTPKSIPDIDVKHESRLREQARDLRDIPF